MRVDYWTADFNGAQEYFDGPGQERWVELHAVLSAVRPQLQASDQASKVGQPIFDPKATNARLTYEASLRGWHNVIVPPSLQPFGKDWDGGKGVVLAEWQFSNYPFLWNNIIRSEAVYQSGERLRGLSGAVDALVIVTKSGTFPSSNSTLYYEQALAQINTVTTLGVFKMPIRLVGLGLEIGAGEIDVDWNTYNARYGRYPDHTEQRTFRIKWGRPGQYGNYSMTLY